MTGPNLRHDEERGTRAEESLSKLRKRATFSKFLSSSTAAALAGLVTFGSGKDINNLWGNIAMAQPRPRQRQAEPEEVGERQRQATEAAVAFRDYIIMGDPAKRQAFWTIYNRPFAGATNHDNRDFMDRLFQEMDGLRNNPQITPLLDAYTRDRDRIWGIRMEPVVMTDFIDAVFNIRERLTRSPPTDQQVQALVTGYQQSTGNERPDSPITHMRTALTGNTNASRTDIEDAARNEIERTAREEASSRWGQRLTDMIASNRPRELARASVMALREFILTGDTTRSDEFLRIYNANTSQAFTDQFIHFFQERISRDPSDSGIRQIVQAYGNAQNRAGNVDPIEFARMVSLLYRVATSNNVQELERIRTAETPTVVDPLLLIVARGMAGRAVSLVRTVLDTGELSARDSFASIMNGNLGSVVNGRAQITTIENNSTFYSEFKRLYGQEVSNNQRLSSLTQSFQTNILPIAIRDIYGELGRNNPNLSRLSSDYGERLIQLVSSNIANLSWLMRTESDLTNEIVRRAGFEDPTAAQLRRVAITNPPGVDPTSLRGRALSEIYVALIAEKQQLASINGRDLLDQNFDQLSWLNGNPTQVQREIDRRAGTRPPDTLAVAIRSRYGTNAGTTMTQAYTQVAALRQRRSQLVQLYGTDFVTLVSRNLDNLQWVLRPVGEIESQVRTRRNDPLVHSIFTEIGYTPGTLAPVLQDIYQELGRPSPNRTRLDQAYGTNLVQSVLTHRANLSWLAGDPAAIERGLLERRDADTIAVKEAGLYLYTSVQFVSAYARARAAVSRRGLIRDDTRDSLGTIFLEPVISRQANTTPSQSPEAVEQVRGELERRSRTIEGDLEGMERQLRRSILGPARPLLSEWIRRWRARNTQIVMDARTSADPAVMERLRTDQTTLSNTMLTESDLRKSVEMAFSMIHLAETGADISRSPQIPGVPNPVTDLGGLTTLMGWFRALNNSQTQDKANVIADVVGAVLHRADPQLFEFIGSMDEPGYFSAVTRTYDVIRGRGTDTRQSIVSRYGDQFVSLMDGLAPNLQFLESGNRNPTMMLQGGSSEQFYNVVSRIYNAITNPRVHEDRDAMVNLYGLDLVRDVETYRSQLTSMGGPGVTADTYRALPGNIRQSLESHNVGASNLQVGENDLYLSIITRVYRAIANPTGDETRDKMARIFGEDFVRVIEAQRANLAPLTEPTSNMGTYRALPQATREAILTAYPPAFSRSVGSLLRTYRHEHESMFFAIGTIYEVLSHAPPQDAPRADRENYQRRLEGVVSLYGQSFVQAVQRNYNQLGFVTSPSAGARRTANTPSGTVTLEDLPNPVLTDLFRNYELGPGPVKGTFMENFLHLGDVLPSVYIQLSGAMSYALGNDQIPIQLGQAVTLYRQSFGSNNYLFNQYFNVELLGSSLQRLARRYHLNIPPEFQNGLRSPEDVVRLMSSPAGRELMIAGRTFFDQINTQYLQQRDASNYHPTTGEFSDANVQQIANQITIFDAMYLGIALERISGADASFGHNAATSLMNAIITLENRDPYLVGPFLLQVLPALLETCQEERTLVASIEAFNQIVSARYSAGLRDLAYSTALNRRYFLEAFARIGQRLPEVTSTFDHNRLEDELRLQPEPRTDQGYLSPYLYQYRPGFWRSGLEPLPGMYGQTGAPFNLLPRPVNAPPGLYVPGVPTLLADADGLYSRLSDQLVPPTARMFRMRVPNRFRINALGASTVIRRLNELFGPMPVDYSDYWLSAYGEAGAYYQHQEQGGTSTDTGGAAVAGSGRTLSGGLSGLGTWTRSVTNSNSGAAVGNANPSGGTPSGGTPSGGTPQAGTNISQTQDNVSINTQAAGIPYPMAGLIPLSLGAQDGTGLTRGRAQFNYQNAYGNTTTITPGQPTTTTGNITTASQTSGLLETYSRIARESATDMLVYVNGTHLPELHAADGSTIQVPSDSLQSRMYFITKTGDIYQLAYGADTNALLLNYLYAGANTQQVLASARTTGRDAVTSLPLSQYERNTRIGTVLGLTADQVGALTPTQIDQQLAAHNSSRAALFGTPAGGFDGAAVGFTVPRGGGDSYSALAFGQLIKDMTSMSPVAAQQAVGQAVTRLLADHRARDVYAAFFRGAQSVSADPMDRSHIVNPQWVEGTGEIMWRRMRIDPMSDQFEFRAVGGYPSTVGASWRHEIRNTRSRTTAYGLNASYSQINLLNQFQTVDSQADQIYARMNSLLVNLYGWQEDTARDTGWLAAGSYMYARMEDWAVRNPTTGTYTYYPTANQAPVQPGQTATTYPNPEQHYASLLFMYWAQRHSILVGAQRVPGFLNFYDRIDQAMRDVQQNPQNSQAILGQLSQDIRNMMNQEVDRFALAWGYDGERIRTYIVGSGQYYRTQGYTSTVNGVTTTVPPTDMSYANLYGLFLFGRPTRAYFDILAHAYSISPIVVSENAGSVTVARGNFDPYADLQFGVGAVDWPSIQLQRYQREVTLHRGPDMTAALSDIYTEMGGTRNNTRLNRAYGESIVRRMDERRDQLSWMIRPEAEVSAELQTRRRDEDPVAQSILNFRDTGAAAALLDIYTELHKATPDMERLERQYTRDMVNVISRNMTSLDWMLLPSDRMRSEFERRQRQAGSLEAEIGEMRLPQPPATEQLNGQEVKRLCEQNMVDVLVSATNATTRSGLAADRYNILLGSHLMNPRNITQRRGNYYVLHTPLGSSAESVGSLVIGDEDDLQEWVRNGHEIGNGITRLEINRQGEDYRFVFSGDRRLRALTAQRLIGGFTLPLTAADYANFDPSHNWTAGALLRVLQDHRHDLIAGALYGVRQYGNERWDQATITFSHRLQMINTATMSDQLYTYVFFNRTTQKVVFASNDVFHNADELAAVCATMGVNGCSNAEEFQRTTAGLGITWARTDIVTGSRLSLQFFFEGGMQQGRQFGATGTTNTTFNVSPTNTFVWRGGFGLDYLRQAPQSVIPTRYFINIQSQNGSWPLIPGQITTPEYLQPWRDSIGAAVPGWSVMGHAGLQW